VRHDSRTPVEQKPIDRALERLARFGEAGVRRVMLRHMFHAELEPLALVGAEVIPAASAL